jgi:hypothetical protein
MYQQPQWGQPIYTAPSTSYYARPMPSSPTYYSGAAAPPAITYSQSAPPLAAPTAPRVVDIGPPPVNSESVGDAENPKGQPEPVFHKGKNPPEVINIQPPNAPPAASTDSAVPTLPPASCSSCKSGHCPDAEPAGPSCGADCQKKKNCHFDVFGDFLYWNVRGTNVPFAQAFDGVDPLAVPRGAVGVALPTFSKGFRAGAGVSLNDHSWLIGTFTYYDNNTHAKLEAGDGQVLHSLLVFPTTVNSAFDSNKADATYGVQLEMGDLDFKCAFVDTTCLQLSYLAGVRYAHMRESLTSNMNILGTTTIDSHINFEGGGPRVGLDGEYRIKGGFYGYGKGILSLLGGHYSGLYEQRNIFAGLQAQTQIGDDRIVPVLELELGVGWVSPQGHIRAAAGYYVSGWFNAMTMTSLVRGIQNNDFTTNSNNFRDTMTFDGFVGHVEFRY